MTDKMKNKKQAQKKHQKVLVEKTFYIKKKTKSKPEIITKNAH